MTTITIPEYRWFLWVYLGAGRSEVHRDTSGNRIEFDTEQAADRAAARLTKRWGQRYTAQRFTP